MVIRTYFEKNNTIISDSSLNTGLNPVSELFYGNGFSRFLFKFDEKRLKGLYTGKTFTDLTKLKHTLKLTNTASFDTHLLNGSFNNKKRASSFDLVLIPIPEPWDEGVGYDFEVQSFTTDSNSLSSQPSSWFKPLNNTLWSNGAGVMSGYTTTSIVATQHFDYGNENITLDITQVVNNILTGQTNNGFMLTFKHDYEQLKGLDLQYVGFFTRHTQTIYEPCIETIYSNHIVDDRANFYLDKLNKLYLYVSVAGNPTNLDALPTVVIYNNLEESIQTHQSSDITHVTKGVYSIDVIINTSDDYVENTMFTDVWSGIIINGVTRPDLTLNFALKDSSGYYMVGDNYNYPQKVAVSISGVKNQEKIKRGEIRKVIVSARIPYTVEQTQNISNLKYRIYTHEGKNQLTLIDFQPVEMTNTYYYFLLDTASLLPTIYYVDVQAESSLEVTTLTNVVSFEILSESNLRNSQ